ncbi:SPARC-related modular calcium-binding protein 2 isoform X2 [Uranotaenia lowii]|uniref:SPARC-related modular calcium-binding protein 2 isoform X2 n=1 Tax=Uranotaenia lowii TaxID=190385 RepID=UPI00247960EC|nr:SPARC-related modular calcium-binding protein 2 isoform X2 [Uranotaenia lowii]
MLLEGKRRKTMKLTILWLITLALRGALAIPPKSEPTTISECTAKGGECDESKGRPVCGTDNQTYPTRCHLIRAQCSGHQVSLKHRGTCKDICLASRTYALQHRATSRNGVKFVPRCREDGTYAPVQCLEGVGCWCVNGQGKPLPNTTVQHGKPVCVKKGKSNQRRSSPRNPVRNNKRSCSRMDRAVFNRNLLKLFENEHIRVQQNVKGAIGGFNTMGLMANSGGVPSEKTVLEWKFASIDGNRNGVLDKNEYRELKRLIKKVVKPKRCGRSFGKNCDADQDERLSRLEWANCFSKDNLTLLQQGKTTLNLRGEQDPLFKDSEAESDCMSDRAAALEEQRGGATALYVPECTADGRYQRVQCYRSTGYCWCVHEDTGKNIPGTSTKDKRPQCDIYPAASGRQMRGCPDDKKLEFLKDLKDFLKQQIASNSGTVADTAKWGTEDEKIATLSFVLLDKNKNKVWERKEWKTFRELVTATRQLRKCGKKMPRYCDVNNDRKITLSEWLNCLQTQRAPYVENGAAAKSSSSYTGSSQYSSSSLGSGTNNPHSDGWRPPLSASSTSKFRGPNPLESVLKSD